jgi:hypothetical protein
MDSNPRLNVGLGRDDVFVLLHTLQLGMNYLYKQTQEREMSEPDRKEVFVLIGRLAGIAHTFMDAVKENRKSEVEMLERMLKESDNE